MFANVMSANAMSTNAIPANTVPVIPYLLITHVDYMVISVFAFQPGDGGTGIIHISGADKFYVVLVLLIIKTM
ncbi:MULTISPECIES: hypothetical protein [unclassified Morganella (in: enterobacteria)]|uniref:hypothetical protein n=1 Tax=unclassified Morganella (in: enterobacteria) TaxID=2676694 RepID=UPI002943B656|nr:MULTISPECIES: hypothetical protein [unclassified Morganella (in: enterobacteria)]